MDDKLWNGANGVREEIPTPEFPLLGVINKYISDYQQSIKDKKDTKELKEVFEKEVAKCKNIPSIIAAMEYVKKNKENVDYVAEELKKQFEAVYHNKVEEEDLQSKYSTSSESSLLGRVQDYVKSGKVETAEVSVMDPETGREKMRKTL